MKLKSHLISGGIVLFSYLLFNYLTAFGQFLMADTQIPPGYFSLSIPTILIYLIPIILMLMEQLGFGSKLNSIIAFSVVILFQLYQIIPDAIYYNFTKVRPQGYFILIYSLLSLVIVLRTRLPEES